MECRHHPTCPGCPLLDLPYTTQLERKRQRIQAAFANFPHLGLEVPNVRPARYTDSYRHRLKLPVHVGNDVAIGLYDPRSGKVLDTPDCPVLTPGLRSTLAALKVWLEGKKGVHALDIRQSAQTGELQAVFACMDGRFPGGEKAAKALLESLPGLSSLAVSRADPERKRVFGNDPKVLAGKSWLNESIGHTRYRLYPGAFFQVDPRNAEQLHELVREAAGDAHRILDLYSGVGAYAFMLARPGVEVVAVESLAAAVEAARQACPPQVRVVRAEVEEFQTRGAFDLGILNPAREGSDPRSLERLAKQAERIVYVSCSPETLARDLDILAWHGKRVDRIAAVDLFPQTPEVEVVVHLRNGPPLRSWNGIRGPWGGDASGVIGVPTRSWALVVGDPGPGASFRNGRWHRWALVAGHGLVCIEGDLEAGLLALRARGRMLAGDEPRTHAFFQDRIGLKRSFVHVETATPKQGPPPLRPVRAPLHGDLRLVLRRLGAPERLLKDLGA